ncbi:TPA: hypothetical protein ACP5W0_003709 [Vibrio parahaemolyticus]
MDMSVSKLEASQRIETLKSCPKPSGWHFGAKIHKFAPVIINLRDCEGASFADIAFFLKTHFRHNVSRQRLSHYYRRISKLIDQHWSSSTCTFDLPNYREALVRIKSLRTCTYWRLRSPLYAITGYLRTLVEIYGYSYQDVSTTLREEEGMNYSRQAIFAFLKRQPKPSMSKGWGEIGII